MDGVEPEMIDRVCAALDALAFDPAPDLSELSWGPHICLASSYWSFRARPCARLSLTYDDSGKRGGPESGQNLGVQYWAKISEFENDEAIIRKRLEEALWPGAVIISCEDYIVPPGTPLAKGIRKGCNGEYPGLRYAPDGPGRYLFGPDPAKTSFSLELTARWRLPDLGRSWDLELCRHYGAACAALHRIVEEEWSQPHKDL